MKYKTENNHNIIIKTENIKSLLYIVTYILHKRNKWKEE